MPVEAGSQALVAALAGGLLKSLELARRRRRRLEQERDLETILNVLERLGDGDLRAVAAAALELSNHPG